MSFLIKSRTSHTSTVLNNSYKEEVTKYLVRGAGSRIRRDSAEINPCLTSYPRRRQWFEVLLLLTNTRKLSNNKFNCQITN